MLHLRDKISHFPMIKKNTLYTLLCTLSARYKISQVDLSVKWYILVLKFFQKKLVNAISFKTYVFDSAFQ